MSNVVGVLSNLVSWLSSSLPCPGGGGGGGGTPIHKLYRDVPPFRVWFLDCPLINRVSNSKIFEDFL